MSKNGYWVVVSLSVLGLAVGCGTGAPTAGTTAYEIRETGAELEITGRDPGGAQVSHLALKLGQFTAADDSREVDGRQLTVSAGGRDAQHVSAGTRAVRLPLFTHADYAAINQFLLDPQVRTALARWNVAFDDRPNASMTPSAAASAPPGEKPYWGCTYGFNASCGATSCTESQMCQDYNGWLVTREYVCCGASKQAVYRYCNAGSGGNQCGNEGPNGCAVCWSTNYNYWCTANDSYSGSGYACDNGQTIEYGTNVDISISYN